MSVTAETAEWLDGPGLVAWLQERGVDSFDRYGSEVARAVYRWREGARANVYAVDKALTRIGFHLQELPDDLWVASKTGEKLGRDDLAEMLARIDAGEPLRSLAREFHLSPSTVRYHRNRARGCTHKEA